MYVCRVKRLAPALLLFVLCGCTTNPGRTTPPPEQPHGFQITYAGAANGPAPEVPGAVRGGVITQLSPSDFQSIDPVQMNVDNEFVAGELLFRTLTGTRTAANGDLEVVGDLATDSGRPSDNAKKWTYTLRDGVKFADGRPITSKDIAYAVGRGFDPKLPLGRRTLQQWLKGTDGVKTPDDRTIVFTFDQPRPDFPFVATQTVTAPVPADKDTKERYGTNPVASGPYQVDSYVQGEKLVLKRNPAWDARTDPLHHQYPDGFEFVAGLSPAAISQRLVADQGADQTATTWSSVTPELLPQVVDHPDVARRVTEGPTANVQHLYINTKRVTDLNVRRALNYAIDRDSFVKAMGGPAIATPATTLLSPVTPGYQAYNAYEGGPDKARELLQGIKPAPLTLASANTPTSQRRAVAIKTTLERAGFVITLQPVDPQFYYATVSKKDKPYDLVLAGYSGLWPDGSLALRDQFAPDGTDNLANFDVPAVTERMAHLATETGAQAVADWARLDHDIMADQAPVVPLTYIRSYTLSGSRVGGISLSRTTNLPSLRDAYVRGS